MDGISQEKLKSHQQQLIELKPLDIKRIEFDHQSLNPLTMLIFVLAGNQSYKIKDITPTILRISTTQKEIDESIDYLVKSNYIKIENDGSIKKLVENLMSTNNVPNQIIRKYHKDVSSYAQKVIEEVSCDMREFQSFFININDQKIPKAKELIRNFMNEFARIMGKDENNCYSPYNFNVQFFPVTKTKDLK